VWRKRFNGDEFDAAPKPRFQEIGERHETIEVLGSGGELDQQVNVAVRAGFAAKHRPKESKPHHTHRVDLGGTRS
jgi:hypothetical protein